MFTDTALAGEAGRFVWLEMNTEKKESAAFRMQYAVKALPTYFIVSPDSETVLLSRVGGSTTAQFRNILDAGLRAMAGGKLLPADELALDADRLYGSGDYAPAIPAYEKALAEAPVGWPARERTVEAMLFACAMTGEHERAARLALDVLPGIPGSPASANIAASGLDAAVSISGENGARGELIAALENEAGRVTANVPPGTASDDISAVYIALIGAREAADDSAGARATAERWSAFLDGAAAAAPTPDARAVFDSHRLSAYLELGSPEKAVPMLEASEKSLPDDYNPPARLAVAFRAMRRYDEALAASRRAIEKSYGPRQLGIYRTKADIETAMGDKAAAVATLTSAVAAAEALPEGQRSEKTIEGLRQKLESIRNGE